ncbi:MAG: hypothetical protein UR68_C0025G0004 [Candidatus Roizmanbacteria bacterium GW2011_GWA2_35_19]|uniref:Uncharacterized protein n=1 Tax=Candidatus Roizmanbacteria bacterium GW2011_GWA2_35_19 TaxID=1618478 RepID=A0A0G0BQU6_9BACT|nr:MAG: hypothetical protein UR68_C0025G0004 [Candidatus Roizmanbacteria bacterium GW2011_GWA2_35_19]
MFIGLFMALIVIRVSSASMIAPTTETHYYSYSVREDGSANVWLRIDELQTSSKERIYTLELPKKTKGEVKAWYRDNVNCVYPMKGVEEGSIGVESDLSYQRFPCIEKTNEWQELKTEQKGDKISVFIPKSKVATNQYDQTMSLGLSFNMENITNKKWWGREIKVETPKFENYISYLSVGVDLPAGVYLRDEQSGPANWGEMMNSKAVMSLDSRGIGDMDNQVFNPLIFDSAGEGQIVKDKSNIPPGESLVFSLMSATSMWKLYTKEIGFMFGAVFVLILVASALLRLIIGRKPIWWYMAIMLLASIFFIIIIWLFTVYKSLFYDYPAPFTNFNESVDMTAPAVEILPQGE